MCWRLPRSKGGAVSPSRILLWVLSVTQTRSLPELMRRQVRKHHDSEIVTPLDGLGTAEAVKSRSDAAGEKFSAFVDPDGHVSRDYFSGPGSSSDESTESDGEEGEPPYRGEPMTLEQWKELKHRAMRPHIAEEHFHKVFPPAHTIRERVDTTEDQCLADECINRDLDRNFTNSTSAASLGQKMDQERITQLVNGFMDGINYASPGTTGCLDLHIDLSTLGVPNVIVSLGVEGFLERDGRTNCVFWRFRTNIGFNYKFWILGADFFFRIALETSVEISELHCNTEAKETYYCQYLHKIVPKFEEEKHRGKCHTDSPYDLILTYLKYQWTAIKHWVSKHIFGKKNPDYFGSPLERDLKRIEVGLLKYPALFRKGKIEAMDNRLADATVPKHLRVDGSKRWIWCIKHESRLCWSKNKPNAPQETSRADKKLLELHKACTWSAAFKDITPIFETITRAKNTVMVPLRYRPRGPLKIELGSDAEARRWRHSLLVQLSQSWHHQRMLMKTRCLEASLHKKDDPYCVLDMPGRQWTSQFHHNTKHPKWPNDGVGFPVNQDSSGCYRGEMTVSVRDFDATTLERWWEWLSSWGRPNPLDDYMGEARLTMCTCIKRPTWRAIGDLKDCESFIAELRVDEGTCKKKCKATPGCKGIEHISNGNAKDQKCFLFHDTCGKSLLEASGSDDVSNGSLLEEDPEESGPKVMRSNVKESGSLLEEESEESDSEDDSHRLIEEEEADAFENQEAESGWGSRRRRRASKKGYRERDPSGWGARRRRRRFTHKSYRLDDPGCDVTPETAPMELWVPVNKVDSKSKGILWWKKKWHELKQSGNVKLQFQWADPADPNEIWIPGQLAEVSMIDGMNETTGQTSSPRAFAEETDTIEDNAFAEETDTIEDNGKSSHASYPGLVSVAQAMFAALDQWLGKIPDYVNQVKKRLKPYNSRDKQYEDVGLDYSWWDGRFGARWNARVEEGEEKAAEEEKLKCPPPHDAGTRHKMKCEMDGMHKKKTFKGWWKKLWNKIVNMFKNPPCANHKPEIDDRVLHFERGRQESRFAKNRATEIGFYADMTGSMMNLFPRIIADVQALFNSYFADEPDWNGNCYGLPAEFMLPYEFGIDPDDGHMRWADAPKDFSRTAIPVKRADGVVSQEGSNMPNDKNPFCKWPWASSRKRQKHRVDFAKQDAPVNGRDNYVTIPREASAHMRPHIWCRVARAYRESLGSAAPFESNSGNGTNGTLVRYKSTCRQVRLAGYGKKGWIAETKQRYECEDVLLSPSFVILFPDFIGYLIGDEKPYGDDLMPDYTGWFGKIGSRGEDVLQCAGVITRAARQFQTMRLSEGIDTICDGSKEHLDSVVFQRGSKYAKIKKLVKEWTATVLQELRAFTDWLRGSQVMDGLAYEFRESFGYTDLNDKHGTMLTGKAWRAGLTVAEKEMGTVEAIKPRIQECKDLAVEEAFKDHKGDVAGLFTLPMTSSVTFSLEMGFAFELSNLCNLGVSANLVVNARIYLTGLSWTPSPYSNMLCFAGVMAPIHLFYLLIDTEYCSQWSPEGTEYKWYIKIKSVIFSKDKLKDTFNLTFGKVFKKVTGRVPLKSDMTASNLNDIIENAAWQMARRMLLDPDLHKDVMAIVAKAAVHGWGWALGQICRKVAKHVKEKLLPIAKEVAAMAFSNAAQLAVKYALEQIMQNFMLMHKDMGIVEVGIKLNQFAPKEGPAENWTREVLVRFSKVRRFRIGTPDLPFISGPDMGFTFKFEKSFTYDFSAAFNKIMSGWGTMDTYFDCCTACLDSVGNAYCQSQNGKPHCNLYYGEEILCDGGEKALMRYMDCTDLGNLGKQKIADRSAIANCKASINGGLIDGPDSPSDAASPLSFKEPASTALDLDTPTVPV